MEQLQSSCEDSRISQLMSFSLSEATRIYSYHREFHFAHDTKFATQAEIEILYRKLIHELESNRNTQLSVLSKFEEQQAAIKQIYSEQKVKNGVLLNGLWTQEQSLYACDLIEQEESVKALIQSPLEEGSIRNVLADKTSLIKKLRIEISNISKQINKKEYFELKSLITPSQILASSAQLIDLCLVPEDSVYDRLIAKNNQKIINNKEHWKDFKAAYFKENTQNLLMDSIENVGSQCEQGINGIPGDYWKAFKQMELIVKNPQNKQPLNYGTASKEQELIGKFLNVSLMFMDIIKLQITHKLLSTALENIRKNINASQTLKQFLEKVIE
ncbi:hypothetical protein FGO68_gene7154 [Halteria grandinella]|uniref:Uncharacterized protein n=1 Tax=Halteria grandinella TaxID=5974 RepID=A0A8J8T433_HALGN|nr:hypothetical protein FGO68_gene7154 [Halteria grandinella]